MFFKKMGSASLCLNFHSFLTDLDDSSLKTVLSFLIMLSHFLPPLAVIFSRHYIQV